MQLNNINQNNDQSVKKNCPKTEKLMNCAVMAADITLHKREKKSIAQLISGMYGFFAIINSKNFAISDLLANFDDLCKNKAFL